VHVVPQRLGLADVGQAQTPLWQLWAAGQTWPHAPQLLLSVSLFVHDGLQKSGFTTVGHTQCPAWHVSTEGHAVPQAPQLLLSFCSFTHAVVHKFGSEAGQAQVDEEQVWLARQVCPHAPQLFGSLDSVAHVPPQFDSPVGQPVEHAYVAVPVIWHTGVPPVHPVPHAPQFVLVATLVAQPVPVVPQSAQPDAHW
jgi:hypothetical protein